MPFLPLKVMVAIDVHFLNHHQGALFQLKIFFTVLKINVPYFLDGLWVSKLTANVQFWVYYPFSFFLLYSDVHVSFIELQDLQ